MAQGKVESRDGGSRRESITVRIKPSTKAQLDNLADGEGVSRTRLVEKAIEEYVANASEREADKRGGITAKMEAQTERLARMIWETQLRNEQVMELMRTTFPRAAEVDRTELRSQARSAMEQARRMQRAEKSEREGGGDA